MGKIAFVFAGQGAQAVGMGKDLCENTESARTLFDMAGSRIQELCFSGPAEELNITKNTQPCLFTVDLACARALEELGVHADGVAGFSLGEIPAAAYAGILSDGEALELVLVRAAAMQECAERRSGTMFAVLKLSAAETEAICARLPDAYPVNYNCEGQTVVACAEETADELVTAVSERRGKALRLSVSGAFHSPFMNEASEILTSFLSGISFGDMLIPLYSNVTAKVYDGPKSLLAHQVSSPVLWQKTIENMIQDGFDTFIEVGPGKTLTGLIKKINSGVKTYNVYDFTTLTNTAAGVKNA